MFFIDFEFDEEYSYTKLPLMHLHTYLSSASSQKLRKFGETLLLPVIALSLLQSGFIPIEYNTLVLLVVTVVVGWQIRAYIRKKIWSYKDIGFSKGSLTEGIVYYLILIAIGVICFVFAEHVVSVREDVTLWKLFLSAAVCTAMQQLLFSGYFIKRLKDIFVRWEIVCPIVVILFTGAHIFFSNLILILPLTAVFGSVLMPLYYFHPNYVFAWLTHTVFNSFVIYIKIFVPIWG